MITHCIQYVNHFTYTFFMAGSLQLFDCIYLICCLTNI